jgi:hypothetical protein
MPVRLPQDLARAHVQFLHDRRKPDAHSPPNHAAHLEAHAPASQEIAA